jgi:hypothetical protein
MADTAQASDAGLGLSLLFGVVALLGALATFGTSYVSILTHDDSMQALSGIALAVTLLAAGVAVAAVHLFGR